MQNGKKRDEGVKSMRNLWIKKWNNFISGGKRRKRKTQRSFQTFRKTWICKVLYTMIIKVLSLMEY